MFFSKKKRKDAIPLDELQDMSKKGLSDREIVKKLKKEGYSYDEIEKAMLSAVREGVETPGGIGEFGERAEEPAPQPDVLDFDPFYQQKQPEMNFDAQIQEVNPEAIIEELIEGVIDEKWDKFNKKFKKYEDDLERIGTTIKQFEQKVEEVKNEPHSEEFKLRADVLSNQIEELEARVGGLEKAFKQFLPSLSQNIENLSRIIHELKETKAEETEHIRPRYSEHEMRKEHHRREMEA